MVAAPSHTHTNNNSAFVRAEKTIIYSRVSLIYSAF